jgi:hypothetical protein
VASSGGMTGLRFVSSSFLETMTALTPMQDQILGFTVLDRSRYAFFACLSRKFF